MIVNAAAESHVEKSIEEGASEFVTTNVEGTQILLDAIRRSPVERFVLISSSEVYGTAEADPMDEEHPLNPRSPYAATKAGGDRLAYSYYVTYGLPIVIVRPFNNYGPRQHPEKVDPALHHAGALGRAAHDPRRRPREPRLALRRRRRRGDRGDHRGAARAARRRGAERRDRDRHLRPRHRRPGARAARQAGRAAGARAGAARPGRPSHRLDARSSNGSPAGARTRPSRRDWSAPSRGIATMRRGGGGFSSTRAPQAPPRPRGGAGAARACSRPRAGAGSR